MQPEPPPDEVSWGSRRSPRRIAWPVAVVLLAAALAAAITLAMQHHGQVIALRHHPRTPRSSHLPVQPLQTVSSSVVALPRGRTLKGTVTVVAAESSGGKAQLYLSARISGGNPNTGYTLIAFDCTGAVGYQSWAVGTTNSGGVGHLSGQAWPIMLKDKFWLYLSDTGGEPAGPGLLGSFSADGTFSASAAGTTACS